MKSKKQIKKFTNTQLVHFFGVRDMYQKRSKVINEAAMEQVDFRPKVVSPSGSSIRSLDPGTKGTKNPGIALPSKCGQEIAGTSWKAVESLNLTAVKNTLLTLLLMFRNLQIAAGGKMATFGAKKRMIMKNNFSKRYSEVLSTNMHRHRPRPFADIFFSNICTDLGKGLPGKAGLAGLLARTDR